MRSELALILAAALFSCSPNRGTGPQSIEVGAQCDESRDWSCEEACLSGPSMCVFRCRADSDCPSGSVCSGLWDATSTATNRVFYCLPLCTTAPCADYDQGLCCGKVLRSDLSTPVSVCFKAGPTTAGGQPFVCLDGDAGFPGDAGR